MPKPTICLSGTLRQFLEVFRPCFSRRQWLYFVTVLLGLVECEGQSTLTGFLRCVGEEISSKRAEAQDIANRVGYIELATIPQFGKRFTRAIYLG